MGGPATAFIGRGKFRIVQNLFQVPGDPQQKTWTSGGPVKAVTGLYVRKSAALVVCFGCRKSEHKNGLGWYLGRDVVVFYAYETVKWCHIYRDTSYFDATRTAWLDGRCSVGTAGPQKKTFRQQSVSVEEAHALCRIYLCASELFFHISSKGSILLHCATNKCFEKGGGVEPRCFTPRVRR